MIRADNKLLTVRTDERKNSEFWRFISDILVTVSVNTSLGSPFPLDVRTGHLVTLLGMMIRFNE